MFYRFIWEMFYLDTVVLSAKAGLHESRDKKKQNKTKQNKNKKNKTKKQKKNVYIYERFRFRFLFLISFEKKEKYICKTRY